MGFVSVRSSRSPRLRRSSVSSLTGADQCARFENTRGCYADAAVSRHGRARPRRFAQNCGSGTPAAAARRRSPDRNARVSRRTPQRVPRVRSAILRHLRDRLRERRLRLVAETARGEDARQRVEAHPRVGRLRRRGLARERLRFVHALLLVQQPGEVVQRIRGIGLDLQRLAERLLGRAAASEAHFGVAEVRPGEERFRVAAARISR